MISGPKRILLFAVLLLGSSTVAFGLSRLYAPDHTLDLTPLPEYVAAPVPPQQDVGSVGAAPASAPADADQLVDQAWVERPSRRTGIPWPAVRAYADAQLSGVGGCDLGWTTLAGIGWVESQHGTLGERLLDADAVPDSPIIGPALDGDGFAAIRSTRESQRWHGDATWEHAVGPMQFLHSSWVRWAADGDGDGDTDPHDLDDAAATAARYLCASGVDVKTGPGWSSAVLSYNHSEEYVEQVRSAASTYAERAAR